MKMKETKPAKYPTVQLFFKSSNIVQLTQYVIAHSTQRNSSRIMQAPQTFFSLQTDFIELKARDSEQLTCNVMLLIPVASIPEIWTFCPTRLAASCNCIPSRVAKLPSVKDTVKSPPATKENSYIVMFLFTITDYLFQCAYFYKLNQYKSHVHTHLFMTRKIIWSRRLPVLKLHKSHVI